MARFIIDDENISIDNLATLKKLGEKDKIYIVTNNRQKLSISVLAWFFARKIKIKIILLESAHKDYADKIITFLMGKLSHKKGKIYIVSIGVDDNDTDLLGNRVVCHSIPIRPGRNLAIIVECAAANHRQKKMGYNAAETLYDKIRQHMAQNKEKTQKVQETSVK